MKKLSVNQAPLEVLLKESHLRGKEASGLAILDSENNISLLKSDLDGRQLLKTIEYKDIIQSVSQKQIRAVIGHSRIATHGTQLIRNNNQPVLFSNNTCIGIHNGIVTNAAEWWKTMYPEAQNLPELDTIVLMEYYSFLSRKFSRQSALAKLFSEIEGSASVSILDAIEENMVLATNTGSLYYIYDQINRCLYFASEKLFVAKILKLIGSDILHVKHLSPGRALFADSNDFELFDISTPVGFVENGKNISKSTGKQPGIFDFSKTVLQSKARKLYTVTNSVEKLRQHDFDYDKINNIRRCTRCILPETAPFISFDEHGVCNYCKEQKKITHKGWDELRRLADKYRKGNGEPDCLAAFSGGKDSSYGIHVLKKELGLQPLAYSYDWGMVTDIARRNQARVLGKLGVEHIVLSADITKKRFHIKQNIQAWLRNPHPGMVTLFMEGDKQCEFYADQLKKKYKLDLMFFFRGNELEIDEFKTGLCGVKDADPGGVLHHLEPWKKVKMLYFYGLQYLKNPRYFNASFFDTSLAFYATYVQKHHYQFLWHYIPWIENEIIGTLKKEYNFEFPTETLQTWRTDDGTSAFYNYIYYHVMGYTENDSFRSRQIREGLLDRSIALDLVNQENKPRYEALRWYFDVVGLDGDHVLSEVDKMKTFY
ncbi:MAG TPA: hypothetical protein PLZ52_01490 [Bacteroidales bacterium]|nr:hypothetical protein [Bacteroidales bacterium]